MTDTAAPRREDTPSDDTPETPPTPTPEQAWRLELMDLGGPNTLIWPRRDTSEVVDLSKAHPGGIAMLLAGRDVRTSDLVRESGARLHAQRATAKLHAHTEAISEEHGLSTCFLAMGTATWNSADESRRPAAPVLLRRCELEPTDVDGDYRMRFVADVQLNPALVSVLGRRLGSTLELTRLLARGRDSGRGFNPEPVYDALLERCADIPGFAITPTLQLGAFPFGKAEAISDLDALGRTLTTHRVLGALTRDEPADSPSRRRTSRHPEAVDASVFDLPEDQQAALDQVAAGEDLFVEAPPGVDAARFIAATVAQAARDGRSVLLLAEKSAALRAVHDRLDRIGLGDLVLHVDDPAGRVDPRVITERWQPPTSDEGGEPPQADTSAAEPSRQRAARAAAVLDGHANAMHTVREPWGVSVADAHDAVVALAEVKPPPRSRVRLSPATLARIDLDAIEEAATKAERVARTFGWERRTQLSPWWRARVTSQRDGQWVADVLGQLLESELTDLDATMTEVFRDITEPRAQSPADHGRFLAAVERIRDTLDIFRPEIFDAPIDPLVEATDRTSDLGRGERRHLVRQARGHLRPGRPPADLHAALVSAQEQRASWSRLVGGGGRPRIPARIDDAHRAYELVHEHLTAVESALPASALPGHLVEMPTSELVALLTALRRDVSGSEAAAESRDDLEAIDEVGLGEVVDDLAQRRVPASAIADEMRYVWWMSVLAAASSTDARYGSTSGDSLTKAHEEFIAADTETVATNARELAATQRNRFRSTGRSQRRLAHSVAAAAEGRDGATAPAWHEALAAWGPLLRGAAPCWAMSPLAVGVVLPPTERFDLVVVDDASRSTVARVASGIARGRQLVVVGDDRQQGPHSYSTDPGIAPPRVTAPTLVDVAQAHLPVARLRTSSEPRPWYPAAASQRGVVHAPAPTGDPRPRLRSVTQGEGTNLATAEADLVARLVMQMLDDPRRSIGVVTFDEAHAVTVREVVADAVRRRPELGRAMAALPEPFLVRPAHRWQREQRDRVVVAVGPVLSRGESMPAGVVPGHPLANPGGERLVRTALTRGRHQMEWVSALGPDDLVVPATKGGADDAGARALGQVLAALGEPAGDQSATDGAPEPGALVMGFVHRLRSAGLRADPGVGLGAYRIDIAVGDADRQGYQLAVSLDRQEYATRAGARARDRVLPAELSALGWRNLRLWETDLYADPARQEAKVVRAVHEACAALDAERHRARSQGAS